MSNSKPDQNSRGTLIALSNANDGNIVQLWADPVLHALLVTSASGAGITSINADTTSAQIIATGTGLSIVDNGTGTHTISFTTTTGSGAVVLVNTPTLITPVLGVATGTSLALGGGAALTTTNQTGTGSLVLATSPTLTNPIVGTQSASDNSTKAASTAYVTTGIANAIAGVNPAIAVTYATTTAGATSGLTYNNGASGIGATLTGANNVTTTFDGHTFVIGDVGITRVLVKNDTQTPSGAFNGVYLFTALHTGITGDVFTRALDYDMPSDINNTGAIPVVSGTVNALTSWILTSNITTVGTDPLTYSQFSINPTTQVTAVSIATANGFSGSSSGGTTPALTIVAGAITPTSVNGLTISTSTGVLTVTNGKTLSVSNSLTLAGTDSTTMTFPTTSATIARTDTAQTFTGTQTFSQVLTTSNAITATSNAATVPITSKINTVTNNSAATLTITLTTTSATDGELVIVRILDSSAVAQTITWVNTENSTVSAPTTSNGSTTLPLTVGFQFNNNTTKWRCIASA